MHSSSDASPRGPGPERTTRLPTRSREYFDRHISMITNGSSGPALDPPLARNSVRRTTQIDGVRPAGVSGRIELIGVGTDTRVGAAGEQTTISTAQVRVTLASEAGFLIESIVADPPLAPLDALVGTSARHGFRAMVGTLDIHAENSLVLRLLQDVPVLASLSRLALLHDQAADERARPDTIFPQGSPVIDICSGWAAGSSMNQLIEASKSPIIEHVDVPAPAPEFVDDCGRGPLVVGGCRRHRRLDLIADQPSGPGKFRFEGMFRDTFRDRDGVERIEHEYGFDGSLDALTSSLTSCRATPRVLPAPECVFAKHSASWLDGMDLAEIGSRVRHDFHGPPTCTHLTEALHGLADLRYLLGASAPDLKESQ